MFGIALVYVLFSNLNGAFRWCIFATAPETNNKRKNLTKGTDSIGGDLFGYFSTLLNTLCCLFPEKRSNLAS